MMYVFSVSNETPEQNIFKILNSEPLIEKHFRYYFLFQCHDSDYPIIDNIDNTGVSFIVK